MFPQMARGGKGSMDPFSSPMAAAVQAGSAAPSALAPYTPLNVGGGFGMMPGPGSGQFMPAPAQMNPMPSLMNQYSQSGMGGMPMMPGMAPSGIPGAPSQYGGYQYPNFTSGESYQDWMTAFQKSNGWQPTTSALGGGSNNPNQQMIDAANMYWGQLQYGIPMGTQGSAAQYGGGASGYGAPGGSSGGGGTPFVAGAPSSDSWLSQIAQSGLQPLQQLAQGNYSQNPGAQALQSFANGTSPYIQQLQNSPYLNSLQSIISNNGNPTDAMPAWQSAVAAMQRNVQEGYGQLNSQLNVGDNRFSTAYGTSASDYQTQTTLGQNALLAQMQQAALENAQGRVLGASQGVGQIGTGALETAGQLGMGGAQTLAGIQSGAASLLGQLGFQGGSQLSAQDFQSQMQQYLTSAQMASQLAGLSGNAMNSLYGGSLAGANNLFNTENNAAMSMYNAQNGLLPQFMQSQLGYNQLGLQGSSALSNLYNQNLGMGSTLGQQQYGLNQNALSAALQNWMYQQPQNNPFLSLLYNAGTYYPSPIIPGYAPSSFGQTISGLGSLMGGAAGLGMLFSDERMKEDIEQIGEVRGLPLYSFAYKGMPGKQVGFMAQEVNEKWPDAVVQGDDTKAWMLKVRPLIDHIYGKESN